MEFITILFKEYESLRKEIEARTNNGYQLWPVAGVVLGYLLSRPFDGKSWLILAISIVVFAVASWTIFRDIEKAAERVREIERHINELAGQELLVWERCWGTAVTGFFRTRPMWNPPPKISN